MRRHAPGVSDDDEPRWTAEERRRLRLAFEERKGRIASAGRVFAGLLAVVVGAGILLRLPAEWWVPAVGIVAFGAVAFRLVGWTCPSCGERLSARRTPSECPGCGLPLE